MAKQRKTAYGIAEDGISLKIAGLTREGGQIYLQALEQVELEHTLYQHLDDPNADSARASVEDINLDDFTAESTPTFVVQPHEKLFQTYSLNQGILAVNTFEEQIIKVPINSPDISQKQKAKIIKENISRQELKSGYYQSSVITINEQSELWIHHGANRLHEILEDFASANKQRFFYQLADANEIALANLFLQNLESDVDDTYMILYLGYEYRRALLFEGNKLAFSLHIHVSQHQSDIDIIYSKLSLAMDEAHIPDPKNLLICGDYCSEDTVVFLRNQLPNTDVNIWVLPALHLDSETIQVYDTTQIAHFILPIALAWKALIPESAASIRSNFLTSYIIEGQKVFKIAWHGYIILGLLFFSSLGMTKILFNYQFELQQEKFKNKGLFTDFTAKKDQAEKMMTMARAIDIQTANIEVVKTLLAGKNPWTEIITKLDDCFHSHPVSWITNLRKTPTGFQITGTTTIRSNIVDFSNLFPNGMITKVFSKKIHTFTVWDFEINYAYPVVNWYEMMEADVQQLRKYQEQRKEKSESEDASNRQSGGTSYRNRETKTDNSTRTTENSSPEKPHKNNSVALQRATIDIPIPQQSLLKKSDEPDVKLYIDFVNAYNQGQKWLIRDLGVKFINNFPKSPLTSYVRWYLSYRAYQNREYDKPISWLEPVISGSDAVKPYAMLLLSASTQESGNSDYARELLNKILKEYPQHQVAKTARKFLNEMP